jgi:hypothetical protein
MQKGFEPFGFQVGYVSGTVSKERLHIAPMPLQQYAGECLLFALLDIASSF